MPGLAARAGLAAQKIGMGHVSTALCGSGRWGWTMNILMEKHDDTTVLTLKEERVDAHNAAELKDRILKALEEGGDALVIDLSQVQFIDSSGLGALLSGFKNANLRACGFALAGLQPRVKSMFELTRLHRVFEIYAGVEEALAG